MTAEQLVDAISTVTNDWPAKPVFERPVGDKSAPVRAALMNDDPLMRALARPNREQVITRRDNLATTLQSLELTNGGELDAYVKHGAKHWVGKKFETPAKLIAAIYLQALGRPPTRAEACAGERVRRRRDEAGSRRRFVVVDLHVAGVSIDSLVRSSYCSRRSM